MLRLDSPCSAAPTARDTDQVFLLPGQWYFGATGATVKTLLGSCVAVTLWHPRRHVGGMCHFLLPTRPRKSTDALDGRFGDEAVALLVRQIEKAGTRTQDYEVHLYGGADTMPGKGHVKFSIGRRNVEKAWEIVDQYGFRVDCVDLGGHEPRNVSIDLLSGHVALKRGNAISSMKG